MMVVEVYVAPGGDETRKRQIGAMYFANRSELADVSDYDVWVDRHPRVFEDPDFHLVGHERADGAWKLIDRALGVM